MKYSIKDVVEVVCKGDDIFVKIPDIPLAYGELTEYIGTLDCQNLDYALLKNAFKRQRGFQVCISKGIDKPTNRFSRFKVEISEDNFYCFVILLPIREKETLVSLQVILEDLKKRGIVFGVQQEKIQTALESRTFKTKIEAAVGKVPVPGRDSIIKPVVSIHKDLFKYVSGITSVSDFVEGKFIKQVKKGDQIAELCPATPGESGHTILGKRTRTVPGEERDFNSPTLEIKERIVSAAVDGYCQKSAGSVTVNPLLILDSVKKKEILHSGSVKICGDVLSSPLIKVTGDLEIHGTVTDTPLEVKGNLVIHGNLMTNTSKPIVVGGDFLAQSTSNADIKARNIYVISSILNCDLCAAFVIATLSSAGRIVGGHAMAGSSLRVAIVGKESGVTTKLSIASPEIFGKVRQLMVDFYTEKIDEINELKTTCQKKMERWQKRVGQSSSSSNGGFSDKLMDCFTEEIALYDTRKANFFREVVRVKDPKFSSVHGEVRVKKIYPMSVILLGKGKREIDSLKENVRFYLKEASILTEVLASKK